MKNVILYTIEDCNHLSTLLSTQTYDNINFNIGKYERKQFPDGERYTRILDVDKLTKSEVIIIGSTHSDSSLVELIELASACVKYGAIKLKLFIPYFGYSTMERAVKSGEVVGAKIRARLISAIPQAAMGNEIYLLDLHSEGIPYYFEGNATVFHLYAKDLILKLIQKSVPENTEYVLGSTDAGRAKWIESLAKDLNVNPAFVYKRRTSGNDTSVTGINADVNDKHVVIYDDMIRSGGSIIQASEAYKKAGAKSVSLITTHALFTSSDKSINQVVDEIMTKTNATALYFTDSHPNALKVNHKLTLFLSVTNIFKQHIDKE